MRAQLDKETIHKLFEALNLELGRLSVSGELLLVGGAVMCLVFDARPSTVDIDAIFQPTSAMRQAAARVAAAMGVSEHWLNDGAKGFMSAQGDYSEYLALSNLRVFAAKAEYVLAMKCLAMRIGAEFHDIDDVRFLLRMLDIRSPEAAKDVIGKYYPLDRFPPKTFYVLAELLA